MPFSGRASPAPTAARSVNTRIRRHQWLRSGLRGICTARPAVALLHWPARRLVQISRRMPHNRPNDCGFSGSSDHPGRPPVAPYNNASKSWGKRVEGPVRVLSVHDIVRFCDPSPAIIKVLPEREWATRRGAILRRTRLSVDKRLSCSWLSLAVRGAPFCKKAGSPAFRPASSPSSGHPVAFSGRLLASPFRALEKFVDAEASEWI